MNKKIYVNQNVLSLLFLLIFLFRFLSIFLSHGNFPVEFSWHYLFTINKFNNNDYTSLLFHDENAQFQFFTDFFALILFKLAGSLWYSKFNTSIIQIIPAIYIIVILFILFYKKKISIYFLILIFLFSASFASLNNVKHFTESHFYFQNLFLVLGLLVIKKNNFLLKDLILLILLLILSTLNMEKASFINYLTFLLILFTRFLLEKNKLFIKFFFILLFFTILTYFILLKLNVPSFAQDSKNIFDFNYFLKIIAKVLFHENSIFISFFLIIYFFSLKKVKYNNFYLKNKSFLFILIWYLVLTFAISLSRQGFYDRYRDFIQVSGFLVFYILLNINYSNIYKAFNYFLRILLFFSCLFLFCKHVVKVIKFYDFSKKNDAIVIYILENYKSNGKVYLDNINVKLFGDLHRFKYNIQIAYDNKLIKFF
jgi:hypothetical protein